MKKFVIVTDSCSDLNENLRSRFDIDYIPMHTIWDDKDLPASLDWEYIDYKEFYKLMRNGTRFMTSQINREEYTERFEQYINEGYDILSISCSSALSASVKGSYQVRDQLLQKYPDSKIICIDSLNACFGLGLICITASKLRAEGKTIEEVAAWIEENKLRFNQFCTVDSLNYFRRAGRVSATSAIFGGLLDIKPIVISDREGNNKAIEKVKGRRSSIRRIVTMLTEAYESSPYQTVVVAHADCEEEALDLKQRIEAALPEKVEILFERIGPIIGATAGPGTLAAFCFGKEVTQ
ncbi:MAG: DegV family protein [Clostridia bacterium]|nr:DegV family protein [Clostridia bacterium]